MKIAVLMSTYNGSKFLDEQLKSLAMQTMSRDMTIYIRDDGSSDDTFGIIDRWKSQINIKLYRESKVGPARSFWGLLTKKEIIADYFLFCDQDDVWHKNKVERQIAVLNEKTCLSFCNCRLIDHFARIVEKKRLEKEPDFSVPRLFVSGVTQGCSMAFTAELRDFIIEKNPQCIPMHDIILMLYAKTYGEIAYIAEPLFDYRVHENNVVAKTNKTFIKRIMTTHWNWKNSSRNSMSAVAKELLKNGKYIAEEDAEYLKAMSKYKNSVKYVWQVMFDSRIKCCVKKELRSYRIRLLLRLL